MLQILQCSQSQAAQPLRMTAVQVVLLHRLVKGMLAQVGRGQICTTDELGAVIAVRLIQAST